MMINNVNELNQQVDVGQSEKININDSSIDSVCEFQNHKMPYRLLVEEKEDEMPQDLSVNELIDSFNEHRTVKDLAEHLYRDHYRFSFIELEHYYNMGRAINVFDKGKLKNADLQKITGRSRIRKDVLLKASIFAECYTRDQLQMLSGGCFVLPWNLISLNLSVQPERLIDIYLNSCSPAIFNLNMLREKSVKTGGR